MEAKLKLPMPSLYYRADVLLCCYDNVMLNAKGSTAPLVKRAGGTAALPVPAPLASEQKRHSHFLASLFQGIYNLFLDLKFVSEPSLAR